MHYTIPSSSHIPFLLPDIFDIDYNYSCIALTKFSNSKQCYAILKVNEGTVILTFILYLLSREKSLGCLLSQYPILQLFLAETLVPS